MLEATKHGIVEFIEKMKVVRPCLLLAIDSDSRGIFSYAILYRRVKIFNFIYGLEETREHITSLKDKFNNNLLHLAGMPAPPSELVRRSGAALQMQRELQWFQAVERVVHPKCKEELNIDCQKPRELFTITHENLMREGEKWAQETARSFTVVGTLIATIMFAAAFTVPGGNNQFTGIPIFLTQKQSNQSSKFWVFAVADAISLLTSSTSVLVFLVILTSRFAEEDFLVLLPIKLIVGLSTLFISVVSMLIAFCAALQLMLDVKATFIIWVYTLAGLTILSFVAFQSPLFLEICRSTIKSEFLPNRRIQNWY
ncbi:ankyrin repeat-containing protein ITN1-like isoform X1 [Quercus lobata]|uniref:ankyrin repeat-containing protein ITN1-like isoform X1 n=1 Tax=Quercus lobata TaxID=97700 RepID=UPI00124767EF|nr:ankyrin repeat-containing protein ITN1-like isoform X1 [Quercus lobata]